MILVDASIIMYAAGTEHAHKQPSIRWLERVARGDVAATIDAETLQEILHRYRAIKRWKDGRQVYDLARQLFPSVVPIDPNSGRHRPSVSRTPHHAGVGPQAAGFELQQSVVPS